MLTEVRKEILTFHHEGFFWRCWFFGEGHSETIWTFWYSKYDATTPYPQHPLTVWIANKYKKGFQGWGDNCLSLILFLFSLSRYQKQTLLTLFGLFFDLHFALRVHRNVETSWWHLIYHNKVFIEWWLSPARTTLPPRPYLLMSVFSQGLLNLSPCLPWQQGGGVFSHQGAKCSHLPLVSAWGRLDVHACGLLECSGPLAVGSGGPWRAVFLLLSTQDLYCKISPVLLLKVIEITRVNKQKWMQKRLVLFWFFFSESTFTLQTKLKEKVKPVLRQQLALAGGSHALKCGVLAQWTRCSHQKEQRSETNPQHAWHQPCWWLSQQLALSEWLEDSLSLGCHNLREIFGITKRDVK